MPRAFENGAFALLYVSALCLVAARWAQPAAAAYFYVQEAQDKCFIESVPSGVALTASYKNHENPGTRHGVGLEWFHGFELSTLQPHKFPCVSL